MGINIGNNNSIKNSTIAEVEVINNQDSQPRKKSFYEKHPIIVSFLISLLAGAILLFSFWDSVVSFVEGLF